MPVPLQFSRYAGSPDRPQLPDRPSKASPGSGFACISARPSCVRFGAGDSNPHPIPAQCIDRQAGYRVGPNLGPLVCQYCTEPACSIHLPMGLPVVDVGQTETLIIDFGCDSKPIIVIICHN